MWQLQNTRTQVPNIEGGEVKALPRMSNTAIQVYLACTLQIRAASDRVSAGLRRNDLAARASKRVDTRVSKRKSARTKLARRRGCCDART